MADDLDDEWWNTQSDENDDVETKETTQNMKSKEMSKRSQKFKKTDDSLIKSKTAIKRKKSTEKVGATVTKTKCKSKRRKISDELRGNDSPASDGDFLSFLRQEYHTKLTAVEWDEIQLYEDEHFVGEAFADCRSSPSVYLDNICPKWKKSLQKVQLKPAHPLMLVITSSAIRATRLNRDLLAFKGSECKMAKLFAKHMKIDEQKAFLSSHVVHLGIGTPNRIYSLLKCGELHLTSTHKIVLDWSWRDMKLKRISDIREIREDLLRLLRDFLIPRVKSSSCQFIIL